MSRDISMLSPDMDHFFSELVREVAQTTAKDMKNETEDNFRNESYGNNGYELPWVDRKYEDKLGYKKLQYTEKMRKSIKPFLHPSLLPGRKSAIAGLKTNSPYAKVNNEGGETSFSFHSDSMRTLTDGTVVDIAANEVPQRQFMGVGSKTDERARRRIKQFMDENWGKKLL